VAREFEADAARAGLRVCYFGAERRLLDMTSRAGHAAVLLGAQPWWNPSHWPERVRRQASIRSQLNRARNKQVRVREWPVARAKDDPGLRACLDEWLADRGLPPLHFLVEPETLHRLLDRRVFVASREGAPVGFLVASPVPARRGWLFEQIIRGSAAPNGTSELLVDAAMRQLARGGAAYVTLGLAPLSRHAGRPGAGQGAWLRGLFRLARQAGGRFYNFEGLDRFKSKLQPDGWEGVWAISNEREFSPGTLYAIAAAFTRHSPVGTLARAVGRQAARLFAA
jgi:phosphatidylglycerol lysyltransferase